MTCEDLEDLGLNFPQGGCVRLVRGWVVEDPENLSGG